MRACRNPIATVAILAVLAGYAAGQASLGDAVSLRLSGELSFNYSGASGTSGSFQGLGFGGSGNLSGFYYDPNFLAFNFQPYYQRAQSESIYETVNTGKGFTASSRVFSGSRFPGSVSYTRTFDSTGEFGLPGIGGVVSQGDSSAFAVSWSAMVEHLPTVTATFTTTASESSVFGTTSDSQSDSRNFTLQSNYAIKGFHIQGGYSRQGMDAEFPDALGGDSTQSSENSSDNINVNVGHRLPLRGYWNLAWTRSAYAAAYHGANLASANDGGANTLSTVASLAPSNKLNLSFGGNYTDNVWGSLQQSLIGTGAQLIAPDTNTRSLSVNASAGYSVFSRMALQGRISHHRIANSGGSFAEDGRSFTQFSGAVNFNYVTRLFGAMTFSLGAIDTATQNGNTGATLVGSVNLTRMVANWEMSGNFGYSQQMATLDNFYMTSMYNYGATAKRRFSAFYLALAFRGSQSGMQQYEGFNNHHEAFSGSVRWWRLNVNGQYSKASGTSVLTAGGLVAVPPGLPTSVLLVPVAFGGESYGLGLGYQPFRRATITGNYSTASNRRVGGPYTTTPFDSTIYNARFQYRLRKLDIDANFTRLEQGIGAQNQPATVNSYYIRVSRWFQVF
jgi:hypothetical protein